MRIFLTGLPGAGKTYLGRLWAEGQHLQFFDLDELIEQEERKTISMIFDEQGEEYFREREAAVLRNTDRFENCIIACGGGTSCFFDNAAWMNRNGIVVFLDELPEKIIARIAANPPARPLMPRGRQAVERTVETLRAARLEFYNAAALTLAPEDLTAPGFQLIKEFIQHA